MCSEPPNKKVTFDLTLYMEKCNPTDDRSVFTGNPLDSDSDSEITPISKLLTYIHVHARPIMYCTTCVVL